MTLTPPKIQLDPWRSDYGGELLPEPPGVEEAEGVRLDVEVSGPWSPRVPTAVGERPRLVFVDGVRRIDARLVVHRPEGSTDGASPPVLHGVAASLAVGAVEVGGSTAARFVTERVRRLLVLPSAVLPDEPLEPTPGLSYEPVSSSRAEDSRFSGSTAP